MPARNGLWIALVCGGALCASPAPAQTVADLSDAARMAVTAEYLTPDERADLAVFHGVWEPRHLDTPARRALAAAIVGAWDNPVFDDDALPAIDRAEAMGARGELGRALELLAGDGSVRAARIRVEALEGLGRYADADAASATIIETLQRRAGSAPELVDAARALRVRARLRGGADDFQRIMQLLAQARDEMDRLYWPALVVEAELLYEKDNRAQAAEAMQQALLLNPSSAALWRLRAELAVDGFDFRALEATVDRLHALRARLDPDSPEPPHSLYADLARARAALRQNDPDGALDALSESLGRYPGHRRALALRAAAIGLRYDFDDLEEALAEFEQRSPGSALALLYAGRALSEARQYDEAADLLRRAVSRLPSWSEGWVELGLLHIQSGQDTAARDALLRAVELDPFHVRADNSLRLIRELLTYEKIESEHFIVRFRDGVDRVMAREMLEPLERIHGIVAGELEHTPSRKTMIELMPNHRWFAVRITGVTGIHTIAAATGPVIAMEAPKIGGGHSGVYDWERVVQHEYAHTVTLSRTRNRIPHWFTEAAAVHIENAPRDFSTVQMLVRALETDTLFDMRQINIAFVRPEKPTDRAQAYAQGHWMYEFIIERFGAQAPLDLMDLYAQGVREDEAMRRVLGVPQDSFIESFTGWARQQARSWGMLPEPTMPEILLHETLADEDGREGALAALDALGRSVSRAVGGAGRASAQPIEFVRLTEERIEALLENLGEHPDLLQLRAQMALDAAGGDPTGEYVHWLERYAAARPVDDAPHRELARSYLDRDDEDSMRRAVAHLRYLDVREQRSAAYAVQIARHLSALGEREAALAAAIRATRIAPFDANHRELAAALAIQGGALDEAERHIVALTELEPDRDRHRQRLDALRRLRAQQSG